MTKPLLLVVDDEESMRWFLDRSLRREGFDVVTANDGPEALRIVRETPPALVLSDVRMPGMDGVALLRALRDVAPGVPVVMMTAHGAVEDALQAMKIGARDYVTKPFRVEQILDVVRRALAASPPAPTVRNVETEGAPRPSPRSVAAGPAGVPGGASSGGLASSGTSGLSTRGASGAGTAGAAEDDGPGSGLASRRGAEAPAPETVAAWLRARVARQALPVPEELHHGDLDLRGMLRLAETVYVDELLRMTEGNVSRAAEIAGITRPNLHRKIQDLGLPVSVYRRA